MNIDLIRRKGKRQTGFGIVPMHNVPGVEWLVVNFLRPCKFFRRNVMLICGRKGKPWPAWRRPGLGMRVTNEITS